MAGSVRSHRRGGAAIEFALVLPVLIALLAAIGEYSWLFLQHSNVVAATREGVRIGVIEDSMGEAAPRVRAVLNNFGMNGTAATVSATQSGTAPSAVLTVSVQVPYNRILVGMDAWLPVPATLATSATMLLESQ